MLAKANAVIIIAHFWVTDLHRPHRTEEINFGMSSYFLLSDHTNNFHLADKKWTGNPIKKGPGPSRHQILENSLKEEVKKFLKINCIKFVRMFLSEILEKLVRSRNYLLKTFL